MYQFVYDIVIWPFRYQKKCQFAFWEEEADDYLQ